MEQAWAQHDGTSRLVPSGVVECVTVEAAAKERGCLRLRA